MSTETLRAPSAPGAPELKPPEPGRLSSALDRLSALARRVKLTPTTALLCVGGLLVVSLLLRIRQMNFYYWVDEGLSVGIASHPLSHIPGLLHQDGSPPLYYMLLHVWMSLRGSGEVATHEFSLICALLGIPLAYWGASSLFGRRAGLFAAALWAGTPFLDVYAQETRMYSLVALLSLLVAISFLQVFVRGRRRFIPLFSLSLVAATYTHNWALFLALMCGVAFLVCLRELPLRRRQVLRDGLLGFGVVAILYLPWVPTLLYQAKHTGAPWDLPPVFWSLTQAGYTLTGGRGAAVGLLLAAGAGLFALWPRWRSVPAPRGLAHPLAAEAGGANGTANGGFRAANGAGDGARAAGGENEEQTLRLSVICLLLLAVGTVLVAWAYSKTSPAWAARYLAVLVGPLALLFGLGLSLGRRLGVVALALVACFWVLDPITTHRQAKSNVAPVAAKMSPHVRADTLVLSTQPEQVPTIAHYLPRVRHFATPVGPVADPHIFDWRDALTKFRHSSVRGTLMPMIDRLRPGQRVLLVSPIALPTTPLWMKLIGTSGKSWLRALSHDKHLKLVMVSSAASAGTGLGVRGYLFIRRA